MNLVTKITTLIQNTLQKLGIERVLVEIDASPQMGDFSTNVAMRAFASKKEWKSPVELANKIVEVLNQESAEYLEKIEVAGPGFINFYLKSEYLYKNFSLPKFPKLEKTTIVEYMQPNTNKPLHVGHLRNAILGKALINLMAETGWEVKAATVNNDRGLHITKSMWAYLMEGEKQISDLDWKSKLKKWVTSPTDWVQPMDMTEEKLRKGDFFVGYWYTKADKHAEDEAVGKQWQQMLLSWENNTDPEHDAVFALWKQMNEWFYQGAKESYSLLNVTFDPDQISFESEIYQAGKEIILDGVSKGIFTKLPDGAVVAELEEKFGLPNKILLRKDGTGIYMTFDIELTRQRAKKNADMLVWVVGNDQDLYFKQLFAVCEMLGYGNKDKFRHFSYGMVRLPEGKMSSRKGTVVYADDVLTAAIDRAHEVMDSAGVGKNLPTEQKNQVANEVGIGAVKYTILSYDPKSQIAFDVDKSVTFEGDSGPYLQYAHARCQSVLEKRTTPGTDQESDWHPAEEGLAHKLVKFDVAIERAAKEFAPHLLATYLLELSQIFGRFYNQCPILGDKRRETLTEQTITVLAHGLKLLGIAAPSKM